MNIRLLGYLFIFLSLASSAFAQTYHDEDFAAGWTTSILIKTPPSATASATTVATGGTGSTPAYRQVDHSNYNSIFVAHVHQPSTYNPATGQVSSIDYSYDLLGIGLPAGSAVAYRLLLVQNGSYYTGPLDQIFGNNWTAFPLKNVLPANFTKISGTGPSQPNLSCTGTPITFGYLSANTTSNPTGATGSTKSGLDNWRVTVNSVACPPVIDPCCPPWNSSTLEEMLFYKGSGGISAPYTLLFQPTSAFQGQIQAYINYLHSLNPTITSITIQFKLNDAGTGAAPIVGGPIGPNHPVTWAGSGPPSPPINFFTESLQVNTWYRISTVTSLNGGITFFPSKCVDNHVDVRIQVQKSKTGAGGPVIQFRGADGHIIEKQLPLTGH